MKYQNKKFAALKKNVKVLSLFNFCDHFNFFSGIAILYFSQVSHSYTLGISIFSLIYLADAVFQIPTGIFSDMVGRTKSITLGAIANTFAIISYALANSYTLLAIGAILTGLSSAIYTGNNDALLYETLNKTGGKEEFHDYLGKVNSWLYLATAIATILGAWIAYFNFKYVLWLSAYTVPIKLYTGVRLS